MSGGGSAREQAARLRALAAEARERAAALEREAERWEAGAHGEEQVAAELSRLPSTWHCLHDRLLRPGRSRSNLDHVAVGPHGVFLVDAKNWSGGVSEFDGTLWQHTSASRSQRSAVEQVGRAAGEMERELGVPVVPVLALVGAGGSTFRARRVGGVEVVPLHRLRDWLAGQDVTLGPEDVEVLARRVNHTYPRATTTDPDAGSGVGETGKDALTVEQIVSAPPRRVGEAGHGRRGPTRKRRSGGRRRTGAAVRIIVALAVLYALVTASAWLPGLIGAVVGTVVPAPAGSGSPATPCASVTAQTVDAGARPVAAGAPMTPPCR